MVYDRTCRGRRLLPGLSHSWWAGGHLYRWMGRVDAFAGVSSWAEALDWLAAFEPDRPIAEVQYWGHGKWGVARIAREPIDRFALADIHPLRPRLEAIRERLAADALWWFRTCETFGAQPGLDFARAWTDFFGGRAAGHTFIIGPWQSGLHLLRAGQAPHWSREEGLREGTPEEPRRAHWSRPRAPNTITCFHGQVPAGY
jgi:hypothetical protein